MLRYVYVIFACVRVLNYYRTLRNTGAEPPPTQVGTRVRNLRRHLLPAPLNLEWKKDRHCFSALPGAYPAVEPFQMQTWHFCFVATWTSATCCRQGLPRRCAHAPCRCGEHASCADSEQQQAGGGCRCRRRRFQPGRLVPSPESCGHAKPVPADGENLYPASLPAFSTSNYAAYLWALAASRHCIVPKVICLKGKA